MAYTFHSLDYVVLVAVVAIILAVGVYRAYRAQRRVRRSGHTKHYMQHTLVLNHQHLRVVPTLLSLLMAFNSVVMILGLPSELYMWGSQWWFAADMFAIFIVPVVLDWFILPWIYKLQLISVYGYFGMRFKGSEVRIFAAILGLCSTMAYMAINIYGVSQALETITGYSIYGIAFIVALATVVYTWMGGMRVINWSDVAQFFLLIIGLSIIIISGARNMQGINSFFGVAKEHGRFFFAEFSLDPAVRLTFWGCILSTIMYNILIFGLDQSSVVRYSATPSLHSARNAIIWLSPLRFVVLTLCYTVGVVIFAWFVHEGCDPLAGGILKSPQQLVPMFWNVHFVAELGMQGMLFAMLFTACIGAVSAGLNSTKITIHNDFLKFSRIYHSVTESANKMVNRVIILVAAIVATLLSFFVATMPGNLLRILFTLRGCFDGPLLGLFMLGGLTRVTDKWGALIGGAVGTIFSVGFAFGGMHKPGKTSPLLTSSIEQCPALLNHTGPYPMSIEPIGQDVFQALNTTTNASPNGSTYPMSFMWVFPLGYAVTFVIGIASSYILRYLQKQDHLSEMDESLFITFKSAMSCQNHHPPLELEEVETEKDQKEEKVEEKEAEEVEGAVGQANGPQEVELTMEKVKQKGISDVAL